MKFADFLREGYEPPPLPENPPTTNHRKVLVSTAFCDAGGQHHPIQVEATVYECGDQVTKVKPSRVKHDGRLFEYTQFLYAIPAEGNQALHEPDECLDTWGYWVK